MLSELLLSFDVTKPNFRPTEIYNESWLVKLVLWQASTISDGDFPLGFLAGSTWFSEALLPTAFKASCLGDKLSESRTHADGVIGDFIIGKKGKADLELKPNPNQFTVVEAKIASSLSKGTKNACYFDQAARNVACMAEVIARAEISPASFARLDFIVLAPEAAIAKGKFSEQLGRDSIRSKVRQRVSAYDGALNDWHHDYFEPTLERVRLITLSWEAAIGWIVKERAAQADALSNFYKRCLDFN